MQPWSTFIRMSGPISGLKNMYSSMIMKILLLIRRFGRSVLPQVSAASGEYFYSH